MSSGPWPSIWNLKVQLGSMVVHPRVLKTVSDWPSNVAMPGWATTLTLSSKESERVASWNSATFAPTTPTGPVICAMLRVTAWFLTLTVILVAFIQMMLLVAQYPEFTPTLRTSYSLMMLMQCAKTNKTSAPLAGMTRLARCHTMSWTSDKRMAQLRLAVANQTDCTIKYYM